MEGRTEEHEKLSCQNPNSSNHNISIRRSPALPRPFPALFHSMSDISPSTLSSLWNQIPLPHIPTSQVPVPVPSTGKILSEKITFRCDKHYVEMSHPCLDPNSDSDPLAKEVTTKVHHEEVTVERDGEKMKISLGCLCDRSHHFFSGHTNTNLKISIRRFPTQTVPIELKGHVDWTRTAC